MSEYVCELPFDDVVSFGSGNIRIPVHECITRCRDCVHFWSDGGYCHAFGCETKDNGFCSLAEPIGEADHGTD